MSCYETMKTYCVHIYERPNTYENVKAKDAIEAEAKIINHEYAGNYDDISEVVVLVQCKCGIDNDPENKTCEDCGKKL